MLMLMFALSQASINAFLTGAGCAISMYCGCKTPVKRRKR